MEKHQNQNHQNSDVIGPKSLIKKHELIRLITNCLYSLGFTNSANCLESESGISCKSQSLKSLQNFVENANWDDCIAILCKLDGLTDKQRDSALFLVFEQYLLEVFESNGVNSALEVLRDRVVGSGIGNENVAKLCSNLVLVEGFGYSDHGSNSSRDCELLRKRLVERLEEVLPADISLPKGRLEVLIERVLCNQIERCDYHLVSGSVSLFRDHGCCQDDFPAETVQILAEHKDEVWFVQFSNNGEYLASSSKDCSAIIWKVLDDNKVILRYKLISHKQSISVLAWSPDDTMLLTCGNMEVVNLWDVETGNLKYTFGGENFSVSSCAWFPDSKSLFCGSSVPHKGICWWDTNGNEIRAWRGTRMPSVMDLAVTPNGEYLITIFSDKEIRIRKLSSESDNRANNAERIISEEHSITSLSVSRDGKFLIINLNNEKIHMWDVDGTLVKPFEYVGHKQQKYVIRSCFGGLNNRFIASGSEDSKVYIWRSQCSHPLKILSGHEKTVNCVSWNPVRYQMLASGSDDCKIRIWGPSSSSS